MFTKYVFTVLTASVLLFTIITRRKEIKHAYQKLRGIQLLGILLSFLIIVFIAFLLIYYVGNFLANYIPFQPFKLVFHIVISMIVLSLCVTVLRKIVRKIII